jgi:RHS repeat-associated protein
VGIPVCDITDRVEYDIYGRTLHRSGTTDTSFLYVGQFGIQTDPTGLQHMRARYYNPHLMRFLNADPIGFLVA